MEFNPNNVDIDEIMLYKKSSDEEKWDKEAKKQEKKKDKKKD